MRSGDYSTVIGTQYARLTLLEILPVRIENRIAGKFRCSCGKTRDLPIGRVVSGRRQSCGCMAGLGAPPKHGMRSSPEYNSWSAMKTRCLNPNSKDYPRYGGAGILICPEWAESFEAFYRDLGPRPAGTSLDRIDPAGHYEPANVRWASFETQAANQLDGWTVEIDGAMYESVEAAARAHHVTAISVVRWCDGYADPRRGTTTGPRVGCRRWRTHS